jgi:hypothetical protein
MAEEPREPENVPVPSADPDDVTDPDDLITADPEREQSPLRVEEQGLDGE